MKPDIEELDDYIPDSVDDAEVGDEIWSFCGEGHVYKGRVLSILEHPDHIKVYEVTTKHADGDAKEYVPCTMAFITQAEAAMSAILAATGHYAQFCANLMHSFTGEAPTGYLKDMHRSTPRFLVGDTVWFQQPHCEYITHKGTVTAIKKIRDPNDTSKTIHEYIIESRSKKSRKKFTQQLTDYQVFGSANQSKMAYAMQYMDLLAERMPDSVLDLVGTEEAEQNAEA